MAVAALPSLLTEVETAVGASRPEAVDAAVKPFRAKAPPVELVRAALEGLGEGGRKLFPAVKPWQLARALGFKGARGILRPAVDYLVKGPRDRAAYETILAVLGKEWVDLEALSSGGRPLDEPGRKRMHLIASAQSDAACIHATLALLRGGDAASVRAEGLVVAAGRMPLTAEGLGRGGR